MTIEVIDLKLADLVVPPSVAKYDERYVYEHLRRYHARRKSLPSVAVTCDGGHLVLTRRYQYVALARELGLTQIRAVLEGVTFRELEQRAIPGVIGRVPDEEIEPQALPSVEMTSHLVFFKTAPDPATAAQIERRFRELFQTSLAAYPDEAGKHDFVARVDLTGPCLEFDYPTPTSHEWQRAYLTFLISISTELAPIATVQGGRFGW
ncbi:MAG TPA: hypothetical protein VFP84_35155 [Kofleriaceae bacterium]|nr:hypothetical protein [Kofleriaceae bacterium]